MIDKSDKKKSQTKKREPRQITSPITKDRKPRPYTFRTWKEGQSLMTRLLWERLFWTVTIYFDILFMVGLWYIGFKFWACFLFVLVFISCIGYAVRKHKLEERIDNHFKG